jgi:kynurenine formamidase
MKWGRNGILLLLPVCFLLTAVCRPHASRTTRLDMTYPLDETAIFWPTAKPFSIAKVGWGISEGGWWYASNEFSASEYGGTHADAPIHFASGGRTIGQVPLEEWIGPAVKCARPRFRHI